MAESVSDLTALYNGDTVEVARNLPDESVDFSVFSPPFASLFCYSASSRDFGNSLTYEQFWEHYRFLVKEQYRVMGAGTICAIHCMDLPTSKAKHGYIGLQDFPGDIIRAYEAEGFIYASRICVWKCPVVAVQRTKALGLLYKQLRKNSAMSRQGIADTIIIMRKPGERRQPVTKRAEDFPVERWQRYASPVWVLANREDDDGFMIAEQDIDPGDTLQSRSVREPDDSAHLCPLQLEVIRRLVILYSNPGEVVWSPFAGIGSEGVVSLEQGRQFVGAELKGTYYRQAARNLAAAMPNAKGKQTSLFDLAPASEPATDTSTLPETPNAEAAE